MGRTKFELPESFIFSTELSVRIDDINYGGHLGNDSVLKLVHESRLRFLKSLGYTELDTAGAGIIMADAVILFKGEVFHGDRLRIDVAVADVTRHGFDLYHRISAAGKEREIARVKTTFYFFDYGSRKKRSAPPEFLRRFDSNRRKS